MIYKRPTIHPGQYEALIEAVAETLQHPDGAGNDLTADAHQYELSNHEDPVIDVDGTLDMHHLVQVVVMKWEEVRLP